MIVVDASVLVEVLLGSPIGRRIEHRLFVLDRDLHAPHLLDLEILHAFRRDVKSGRLDELRAAMALGDLSATPLTRHAHDPLVPRIWALRNNLSAYDAAYVALAEFLDAPLITCDVRLAKAPGHRARIEVA